MGVMNSELNYDLILKDLGKCCLGEEQCGSCSKEQCIVGFAKGSITKCFKEGVTYVENGADSIPVADLKMYIEEDFEAGIAHILRQCRSCKEDHFDNCVVSVLRNCYEVGLFGETKTYHGSALAYLSEINESNPQIAANISEVYKNTEE